MTLDIKISEDDLPVLPAVASQAMQLLGRENVSFGELDGMIRRDPSLTERVLHMANSPFYSGKMPFQTLSDAIGRLGLRQLHAVLTTAATGDLFNGDDPVAMALWEHSLATAVTAQLLAEKLGYKNREAAYIGGMLHDVGKLVIHQQHPEPFNEIIEAARQDGRRIHEIEQERFKFFDHCTVGGLVIRKWKLDDSLAEAARFHHEFESDLSPKVANRALICIVTIANLLTSAVGISPSPIHWDTIENLPYIQKMSLTRKTLEEVTKKSTELFEEQRASLQGA